MHSTGRRLNLITFLGALCMLLSAVEYAIPKPVPFMRLGLANLPVLLALYIGLSASEYFLLVALKILTQALVSGTLFSYVFLFSLAGSLSSATVMWLLFKAGKGKGVSTVGISLGGALANNSAQIALSYFLLFGSSTRYIAPVLLITGAITAAILGFFAEAFMSRSHWFAAVCVSQSSNEDILWSDSSADKSSGAASESTQENKASSACKSCTAASESVTVRKDFSQSEDSRAGTLRFFASLCLMLVFLFIKDVFIKTALTVFFYIAARIRRRKVRILPSLVILVTVSLASLLSPAGKVLFRPGDFPITLGALESGLLRAFTLVGMVFLSQYATSGTIKLPGKTGVLLENVFFWFSKLSAKKLTFRKGSVIETLDAHLCEIYLSHNPDEK